MDLECSELEKELASTVGNLRVLYEEAGADSEEKMRSMFEAQALRSSLESRMAESRLALAGILGSPKSGSPDLGEAEFLMDGLALAEETEALKLAVADCEKTIETLSGEVRALEEQIGTIESDDRVFTLRQRNEALKATVQKKFSRWLALVLLTRFARNAAQRCGESFEPDILRQAQQFLSLIAGPGWKIVPEETGETGEKRGFRVALEREADGLRLDETQWSSGLREQVLLSVRLAVAYRLAERPEPVPIILDDALARFDESRQRGAAEALWRVSEKTQVIFFTCNRFIVDMFRSRLSDEKGFSVVEMPVKGHKPPVRNKKRKRA